MPRYANGRIPAGVLFTVASGYDANGYWEFQFSAGTWAKWQAAKRYAETRFGRTLYIRPGWNVYRPYNIQDEARDRACARGNCLGAAWPGTSSHGGTWSSSRHTGGKLVDALAIDVDPNGLTWAQVWEACRAAGFLCGAITKDIAGIEEPWHIIDLDPWRAVPAGESSTPFEEDDMTPEQARQLNSIFNAIFHGGNSMKDGGKSISQSLRDLQDKLAPVRRGDEEVSLRQEIADAKTAALDLKAQNAALLEAIKQIGGGGSVDLAAIQAAAERGAREAIKNLTLKAQ